MKFALDYATAFCLSRSMKVNQSIAFIDAIPMIRMQMIPPLQGFGHQQYHLHSFIIKKN